ncbi:MAG: LPS-assembly protein LptD [Flavobacteriales bacterium]|nr:LPS-assembly protein LptD [Flavobacteriales bacterium]
MVLFKNIVEASLLRFFGSGVILMPFFIVFFSAQVFAQQSDTLNTLTKDSLTTVSGNRDSLKVGLRPSKGGLKVPVMYDADDSVKLDMKEQKVILYKKAIVTYEDMKLEADYIELSFKTNEIYAKGLPDSSGKVVGKPIFTTDGRPFNADEMWYNFKTKKGISTGVITTEQGGIIRGEKVLKDSANNTYIKNATYTTCNAEHPHFWIEAKRFKVIPDKQVVSGPANLVVEGVNTPLVLPFGFFPLHKDRSKGLVVGSYTNQDRWGYGLTDWGFYLPMNQYSDVLLKGDIYLRGSWGLGATARYKKLYKYDGSINLKYNKFLEGEKNTSEYAVQNNFLFEWIYRQDAKAKPNRTFNANVRYVTKNQQRYNASDINDLVNNSANSSISYNRSFFQRKINMTSSVRVDQVLNTGSLNITLPDIGISANRILPFKNAEFAKKTKGLTSLGITYNSKLMSKVNTNQDSVFNAFGRTIEFNPNFLESIQSGMRHDISVNTSFSFLNYFNITPSFNYNEFWYLKTTEKIWQGDSVFNDFNNGFSRAYKYYGGFSLSTNIYGMKDFKGKIKAIRHVVQPSVGMSFSPDFTSQKFGYYQSVQSDTTGRYTEYSIFENGILGGPSGKAQAALIFGVNNSLEMKIKTKIADRDTVQKVSLIQNLRVNGSYNFIADSLKLSNLTISGFTTLFRYINLTANSTLNPYLSAFDTGRNQFVSIDKYAFSEKKLGTINSFSLQLGTNLSSNMFANKKDKTEKSMPRNPYVVDFSEAWNVGISYIGGFQKSIATNALSPNKTLNFSGSLTLTPNWQIGFESNMDIIRRETVSSFVFTRKLHCWGFVFRWVPTGPYRQFSFELKPDASMLKDLRIKKRDTWQNLN